MSKVRNTLYWFFGFATIVNVGALLLSRKWGDAATMAVLMPLFIWTFVPAMFPNKDV